MSDRVEDDELGRSAQGGASLAPGLVDLADRYAVVAGDLDLDVVPAGA